MGIIRFHNRFRYTILKTVMGLLMISMNLYFSSCGNNIPKEILSPITIGEIKCGYDDQICFYTTHDIVRTEEGYYFIAEYNMLYFFDIQTQKTIPVCSQPNCIHTPGSVECDANLTTIIAGAGIWYYDNELYIKSYDNDNHTYFLLRISKDGSKRTRCCNLLTLDPETAEKGTVSDDIHNLIIHRGYAYFTAAENETKYSLFQVELKKNATIKKIYTIDGNYSTMARLKGYGNGLYFQSVVFVNNSKTEYNVSIYYYDLESDSVKMCIENQRFDYFPYDGNIYFSTGTKLNMIESESSIIKTIYENDYTSSISFDGKYFYLDNLDFAKKDQSERYITVLDTNGKIIDKIAIVGGDFFLFGDNNYMFCYWLDKDNPLIKAFDKTQIGTDSKKWIDLVP